MNNLNLTFRYLKENGIYKSFLRNCMEGDFIKTFHDNDIDLFFSRCIKNGFKPSVIIDSAFNWTKSREGFDYWKKVSIEIDDFINRLIKN